MPNDRLRLYSDFAHWWPLMSPPSHYVEEAADLMTLLLDAPDADTARTLLELGSGGGSLAYHLKERFALTLTDISPEMLAVNKHVNPESEHIVGDMTSLDLGRQFDRVVVHDAIMYATTPDAVRAALRTAERHTRPGGLMVVLPDCVRETLELDTDHGGEDGDDGRAMRYLEWSWDPDPSDFAFETVYVLVLRDSDGQTTVIEDRHTNGCFPRADWLSWFAELGLKTRIHHDQWEREVFVARKADHEIW